jgi:hypothetical protein
MGAVGKVYPVGDFPASMVSVGGAASVVNTATREDDTGPVAPGGPDALVEGGAGPGGLGEVPGGRTLPIGALTTLSSPVVVEQLDG